MISIDRFFIGCFENNRSRQCDPPCYPARGIQQKTFAEFGREQSPKNVSTGIRLAIGVVPSPGKHAEF
jgi:hypothetical protein